MLNSQLQCRNAGFAVPQTTLRSTVGCDERETEWDQRRNGWKGFVRKLVDSAADIVLAAFAIASIVVLVRYSDASLQTMRLAAFAKKRASAIFILSRRLRAHEGDSARVLNGGWLSACVTKSGGRFDCSMRVVGQCNMQQTCHIICVHIWEIAVEKTYTKCFSKILTTSNSHIA